MISILTSIIIISFLGENVFICLDYEQTPIYSKTKYRKSCSLQNSIANFKHGRSFWLIVIKTRHFNPFFCLIAYLCYFSVVKVSWRCFNFDYLSSFVSNFLLIVVVHHSTYIRWSLSTCVACLNENRTFDQNCGFSQSK